MAKGAPRQNFGVSQIPPSTSSPLHSLLPFLPLPLEVGPLNTARGSEVGNKLSQQGGAPAESEVGAFRP